MICSLYHHQAPHPNLALFLYNIQVENANKSSQETWESHVWALLQSDQIKNQESRGTKCYVSANLTEKLYNSPGTHFEIPLNMMRNLVWCTYTLTLYSKSPIW